MKGKRHLRLPLLPHYKYKDKIYIPDSKTITLIYFINY